MPNETGSYALPSSGGYELQYSEGYASGLPYVPRDNFPARLHEGEAVLTKQQAEKWRGSGGQTINFSPSINISGSGKSAEDLAREIVKPLQSEMRRLKALAA